MQERLGWLIITLGLAGCTSRRVQLSQDQTTYDHDLRYCRTAAYASVMMTRNPSDHRRWLTTRLRDCMRARGWPVKDEDHCPHVGPSDVAKTNVNATYPLECQVPS
jgi:hypothetical protein